MLEIGLVGGRVLIGELGRGSSEVNEIISTVGGADIHRIVLFHG